MKSPWIEALRSVALATAALRGQRVAHRRTEARCGSESSIWANDGRPFVVALARSIDALCVMQMRRTVDADADEEVSSWRGIRPTRH
jgi:hypothetical protein